LAVWRRKLRILKGLYAGKSAVGTENLFDTKQLVVFRDSVASTPGARLYLTGIHGDGEIGNRRVFGLAGSMGDDRRESIVVGQSDGFQRLGECSYLIQFDQDRIGASRLDALSKEFRVRDEEIVADDLDLVPDGIRKLFPSVPVVFGHAVLERDDWET
jgi:hypothetical protein